MYIAFGLILLLLAGHLLFLGRLVSLPFLAARPFRWFGLVVGLFLLFQVWCWLRPSPVPLTPDQERAVRDAVSQAIGKAAAVEGTLPATAAVVHLHGDPTDQATAAFRAELAGRDGWTAVAGSPAVSFLKSVGKTLYEATSVDEYLRPGARVGIDVVFHGRLLGVSTTNGVSRATLSLSAYDTRRGETVASGSYEGEFPRLRTAVARAAVRTPLRTRIWIFAVFALALPWVCAPLAFRVRRARSNAASAALLAGLTGADLVLGGILFYGLSGRALSVILVVLACIGWNLLVSELLARRA